MQSLLCNCFLYQLYYVGLKAWTYPHTENLSYISQFDREATNGQGAMCNRIIMFLTDGGTEMPEEVFEKYNKDKRVNLHSQLHPHINNS